MGFIEDLERTTARRIAVEKANKRAEIGRAKVAYKQLEEASRIERERRETLRKQARAYYTQTDYSVLLPRLLAATDYPLASIRSSLTWRSENNSFITEYNAPVEAGEYSEVVMFSWHLVKQSIMNKLREWNAPGFNYNRYLGFAIEVTPDGELAIHGSGSSYLHFDQWKGNHNLQEQLLQRAYLNPFELRASRQIAPTSWSSVEGHGT